MAFKRLREKINLYIARKPAKSILLGILFYNLVFLFVSALIISRLAPASLDGVGFWDSVFYTVSMILDAGCIQYIVSDVGQTGALVIIICMIIVIMGMITFTGAVIGYVTSYISNFIETANAGRRKLYASNHTVILNWNTRAAEIINDLLYSEQPETVVVLVPSNKEAVEEEVRNRISETLRWEYRRLEDEYAEKGSLRRRHLIRKNMPKNRVSVIVRTGDIFSTKQLYDISVDKARSVIILSSREYGSGVCRFETMERMEEYGQGNILSIKTLIQVADITAAESSADDQRIVVEVEDDWTMQLVNEIIAQKERMGKCNIIPVCVNMVLGQLLSQFTIMPELNRVYSELFSNRGAFFSSRKMEDEFKGWSEERHIRQYMARHYHAIPLTVMETKEGWQEFYMTDSESSIDRTFFKVGNTPEVSVNHDFAFQKKNIVILGHNSKIQYIMNAFNLFRGEWMRSDGDVLDIVIIDDKKSLEQNDYFRQYPYVTKVVEADVYDRETICRSIIDYADSNQGDTSVLILSDDSVSAEEIDAKALTYLIYVQEIFRQKKATDPDFDPASLDVVIEVLNPKNSDVVRSYSVDNIVISNRYISKMITQIGEKEAIYDFYSDILAYDEEDCEEYDSKELYIKPIEDFYETIPEPCTADELIRATFDATPSNNHALLLGYIRDETKMVFFSGNQTNIRVELRPKDKLIIFSNH